MRTDMNDINILFVDDEKFTLHSLDRLLRKESYNTLFAEGGEEALKLIAQNDIHIVVSDMKMPEMDGLTLLRKIKENNPNIVRLVLSAYTQTAQLLPCINSGEIFRFITKPLDKRELKTALTDAIELHLIQCDKKQLVGSLKRCNEQLLFILEEKRLFEGRMKILCGVDELTSLYNRRQLYASLEQELNRYHRYGNRFSGLMLELDHLQNTIDIYGQGFGDYVVTEFASRLKTSIRNVDIAFRYADDKFFVMLPETGLDQTVIIGERMIENCCIALYSKDKISFQQTVSVGAYTTEKTRSLTVAEFLSLINKMQDKAKEKGMNQVFSTLSE
jgi:diguanylate cyclase (GGDEF)-like protein